MESTETETKYTKEYVKDKLLSYAWAGMPIERAAEVECIVAQGRWKNLDARVEQLRAQAFDDTQAEQAEENALTELYECHASPHLVFCPANRRSGTHV